MSNKFNPGDPRWRLMCPNPQRAAENRERIRTGFAGAYWDSLETIIAGTPRNQRLPSYVPVDNHTYRSPLDKPRIRGGIIDIDEEYIISYEKGVNRET